MKTRKGVEIVRIGRFKLSTGDFEFTKARLKSAVEKAIGRSAPRIGIGHQDPRWNSASAGDGDPALGRVENMTLSPDGEYITADLVDMPDWFADALPSAFPGRSVEGPSEGDDFTITALKVLGTTMPGIHSLEDLRSFVSDEGPALVAAGADNEGHQITVFLSASGLQPLSQPAATQPTTQEVVRVDPKMMREALGLPEDATDEQVKTAFAEKFEPAVAPEGAAAPAAPAAPAPAAAPVADPAAPAPAAAAPAETPAAAPAPSGVAEPVTVAASVWQEQQTRLETLEKEAKDRREAEDKSRRDIKASAAVTEGKIAPAEKDGIRSWLDDNEETATAFIDSLTAGRVPVTGQLGHNNVNASASDSEDALATAVGSLLGIPEA